MPNIVFCATHVGGVKSLSTLIELGFKPSYIVTISAQAAQHHQVSGYFDFTPLSVEHSIPIYYVDRYDLKSQADESFFLSNSFDLLVQGGWQRLFPKNILDTLSIGALGLHGSSDPLPKGRGRSPLNWSLIEDKKRFLMHLFLIDSGADSGEVIDIVDFDILDHDDIRTLYIKYALSYDVLLRNNLKNIIEGNYSAVNQVGLPSYYPKRSQDDAIIDWEDMDVFYISRLVRAVTRPYPGAQANIGSQSFKIWKCRVLDTRLRFDHSSYGEIVDTVDEMLIIKCRGGLLLLEDFDIL